MEQIFKLSVTGGRENAPDWLTQDHLEKCAADEELQKNWIPKVGDWYFCRDLYEVMQIKSLEDYYAEGDLPPLKTDHGKDARGHWQCDIYIPAPTR